ncbi:MAG TPA: hypothetical protein PLW68_11705 [Casimicrobiaceae bacterium]|nr:hypothetical protein [Casimicrobiaceae bacterium]
MRRLLAFGFLTVLLGAVIGCDFASAQSAPVLQSAALRRTHGAAGLWDLQLSLNGATPNTETRSGPSHLFVLVFDKPVISGDAVIDEGIAATGVPTFSGNEMTVPVTNVLNSQYVTVTATNVVAQDGGTGGSGSVRAGFLFGDVNLSGQVVVSDVGIVNAALLQPINGANFLKDVNADGKLAVSDKGLVNSQLLKKLPTPTCLPVTGAGTTHGTIVPGDTWTEAGNPHIVTFDVSLTSGTLTLDPCVVVRVQNGYSIRIGNTTGGAVATLNARGSLFRPIVIESPVPTEYWGTLRIFSTGHADLEHVTLRRAGNPATAQGFGGALQVNGDGNAQPITRNVHVRNVRIETSATMGLNVQASGGLSADSTGLVVTDSGKAAGANPVGTYAAYVTAGSIGTLPPGQYTGNQIDEIIVDNAATVPGDETFRNLGVPYRMNTGYSQIPQLSAQQGGLSTLTIEAGVTIKLLKSPGNDWKIVLGASNGDLPANIWPVKLIANGTLAKPIVFTSASLTPTAGDWAGIRWSGGPATGNVVNYVRVEYAGADSGAVGFGCGPSDNDSALLFLNWIPGANIVQNSTFSDSAAGGIVLGWVSDASFDFKTGNTFTNIANGCAVARWKNKTPPACPSLPPVCF